MGLECVGHRCTICRKVYKTRKRAKEHVQCSHPNLINIKVGPGGKVEYVMIDLRAEGQHLDDKKVGK